jgi:hypothetical protein
MQSLTNHSTEHEARLTSEPIWTPTSREKSLLPAKTRATVPW